jgi:hypothetical protein
MCDRVCHTVPVPPEEGARAPPSRRAVAVKVRYVANPEPLERGSV